MNISQVGINLIKSFEGCQLKAYQDPAKVWTIGYGHTSGVRAGQTITQQQADEMLVQDLAKFCDVVTNGVHVPLNQYQFDALVSFTYNVGQTAFLTSTLLQKLNRGDYVGASSEFGLWIHAGGKVLQGLVTRRNAEQTLFNRAIETPKPVDMNTYVVQSGDTLSGIAQRFGKTVDYLVQLNGIANPDFIQIGQVIKLVGAVPTTQNYTIRSGENLTVIARRFNTSVGVIVGLNPQIKNPNLVYAGQQIKVPLK